MPVHGWTRVDAQIFHDFQLAWSAQIQKSLNDGLLPDGYYALVEQHAGRAIVDILTLGGSSPLARGAEQVAEAPPRVRRYERIERYAPLARRRTVAIRHVSGHRLVALLEIVSPANKDRRAHVEEFATKAVDALDAHVHLLLVDLFPPGPHDPYGMHSVIHQMLEDSDEPYDLPADEPLTLASYAADTTVEIYLEHLAPGAALAEMPLFLSSERYVGTPLESTYAAAYRGMPAFWRNVLEGRPAAH